MIVNLPLTRVALTVTVSSLLVGLSLSKDVPLQSTITDRPIVNHVPSLRSVSSGSQTRLLDTSAFLYLNGVEEADGDQIDITTVDLLFAVQRGGGLASIIPAGYNPFGYQITELGIKFLEFEGSLDCDLGRFLASVKSRKRFEAIKSQWLEILRVSKTGQSMRIYKGLDEFIKFGIKANLLD